MYTSCGEEVQFASGEVKRKHVVVSNKRVLPLAVSRITHQQTCRRQGPQILKDVIFSPPLSKDNIHFRRMSLINAPLFPVPVQVEAFTSVCPNVEAQDAPVFR